MELFTYLMAKNDHNTSVKKDLFSYLLGKNQSGTYTDYSGTSLSINNTKKGKMKVNLLGNTSQETTTGKNIFSWDNPREITLVKSGTRTTAAYPLSAITLQAGTYTLSFPDLVMKNNNNNLNVEIVGVTGGSELIGTSRTFTITEEKTLNYLYIYILSSDNDNATATFSKIMLNTGATAETYEPYTNGASPNPSYPQDVNVVSGDNTIVSTGKNLFDKDAVVTRKWLNISGELEATDNYVVSDYIEVIAGDTYYIPDRQTTRAKYYKADKSVYSNSWDVTSIAQAITIPTGVKYIRFSILVNGTGAINLDTFQFERNTTPTTYEPYTSTSYPIHLGEYELCKIGDYKDGFVRSTGKNLASLETSGSIIGGVSFTKVNGVININGTTTGSANYFFDNFQTNKSGSAVFWIEVTGYTDKASGNSSLILQVSDNGTDGWTALAECGFKSTATHQQNVTLDSSKYYRIRWYTDTNTFTNATIMVQLEYGSSKTYFEPYGNGDWYLKKKIGKYTFTGNETINTHAYGTNSYETYITNIKYYPDNEARLNILCDYFRGIPVNERSTEPSSNILYVYNANGLIVFKNTSILSVADFKTFMTGKSIIFQLSTPTYTKIEGTLKEQLEAVWRANSYKGTTNINQINNDLPFNMDVSVKVGS